MKTLAFVLASLLTFGCTSATDSEIEAIADDPELVADIYEVTRDAEIEIAAMSATRQRDQAQRRLVEHGVITPAEVDVIVSVFREERTPAQLSAFVLGNVEGSSPVAVVLAAALRDGAREPGFDPLQLISNVMKAALRGAVAGHEAGGKRGAAFAALVSVQSTVIDALNR